jgi:hypothetical protein
MADDILGILGFFANGKAIQPNTNGGILDAFIRGAANGATFQAADALAAAGDATLPLDAWSSQAPTWGQRFDQNMDNQYLRSQSDTAAHPDASGWGQGLGAYSNPAYRFLLGGAPNAAGKIWGGIVGTGLDAAAGGLRTGNNADQQKRDLAQGSLAGAVDGLKSILGW